MNILFIASKTEILEAFSRNNDIFKTSEPAWSNKAFQAYLLLRKSNLVLYCGAEYFYAQLNEEGVPTDLLQLSKYGYRADPD
ncbi:unnamed protein product, partial [Allacma fusca]